MKREAGLWIDHRHAVVVILAEQGEQIQRITSNVEKHVRYSGASHSRGPTLHDDASEDGRDRRLVDRLNKYYDEVIAILRDSDSILILGPGEAKGEFQKRLEATSGSPAVVAIEATDKLTDGQIASTVRQHFHG